MVSLTILTPAMEIHRTGCADVARSLRQRRTMRGDTAEGKQTFEGETVLEAVLALDVDLADMFCEEPYTPSADENGCWTTPACSWAPCIKAELGTLVFDPETNRPRVRAAKPAAPVAQKPPRKAPKACKCGCGEMTRGGTFRPGHDARFYSHKSAAAPAAAA